MPDFQPSSCPDPTFLQSDQLNSTALKWGNDGELSQLDLDRILRLLSQADPVAEALLSSPLRDESSICR